MPRSAAGSPPGCIPARWSWRVARTHSLRPRLRTFHLEQGERPARPIDHSLGSRVTHQDRCHDQRHRRAGPAAPRRSRRAGVALSAGILWRPEERGHRAHAAESHQRHAGLRQALAIRAHSSPRRARRSSRFRCGARPGRARNTATSTRCSPGIIVERVSGQPLDRVRPFRRYSSRSACSRPATARRRPTKPTPRQPAGFAGQPVGGVVNDRNAATLGGVSGHAGVFSTGYDLARFAQGWLRAPTAGATGSSAAPSPNSWRTPLHSGTRVLGWDTPLPPGGKESRCTAGAPRHPPTGTPAGPERKSGSIPARISSWCFSPTGVSRRAIRRQSFLQLKEVRAKVADAVRAAVGTSHDK